MEFLQTFLLLVLIVSLGAYSRYKKIFKSDDKITLSSFVYNFAFPALLIATFSKLQFDTIEIGLVLGSVIPVLFCVVCVVLLYMTNIISKDQMVLFAITFGFGSNAFFGIAYFDSLYGDNGLQFAVIAAAVLGILGVIIAIGFLEYAKEDSVNLKVIFKTLISPPVAAVVIGVILALFELNIPFIYKASNLLGKTAGGLAIFALGMFIYDYFSWKLLKEAIPYVLARAIILPIVTFVTLLFFSELTTELKSYLLQQSGIPAAISIAIFAQKYQYYESRFAGIVILSSLVSFLLLGILYFLFSIIK